MAYGLVVKALESQSRGPGFKTTGWLQGFTQPLILTSSINKVPVTPDE